jgi:MraZ protein
MFFGNFERTMDDKGRVPVPPEFRAELGEEFIGYTADEPCVELLPKSAWEALARRVEERDPFKKDTKRLERIYFGGAHRCMMDEVGRIRIPSSLREAAGLGKNVVFVGVRNRIELWDPDVWRETRSRLIQEEE